MMRSSEGLFVAVDGVLLNTSLNLHGQPIARTARDALGVFQNSGLRYLQLGPYLVQK
jgi:carbamoyltransferase